MSESVEVKVEILKADLGGVNVYADEGKWEAMSQDERAEYVQLAFWDRINSGDDRADLTWRVAGTSESFTTE